MLRLAILLIVLAPQVLVAQDTIRKFYIGGSIAYDTYNGERSAEGYTGYVKQNTRGITTGINILYKIKPRLSLESGANYGQINFHYTYTYYSSAGPMNPVTSTEGRLSAKADLFSIPLMINFRVHQNSSFFIGAGGSLQIVGRMRYYSQETYGGAKKLGASVQAVTGFMVKTGEMLVKPSLNIGYFMLNNEKPVASTSSLPDGITLHKLFASIGFSVQMGL